jgi:hypothetical protein
MRDLVLVVLVAAAVLGPDSSSIVIAGPGWTVSSGAVSSPSVPSPSPVASRLSAGSLEQLACERVDPEALLRTARGVRGNRSGDILVIPQEPDFVNGGLTHATPFDYSQEVPVLLYGPGYVRPGTYGEPITLADVAPTTAALLKFPFDALGGQAQSQALLPEAERPTPALVVTVVWDSVGDNVLERWPGAWPFLDRLREDGAWFTDATVGASPSNTPVAHASMGTGAFPMDHGLVDVYIRREGVLEEPNESGPGTLLLPTVGDLFDQAMGNVPVVGTIGTLSDHLMMMSHGSQWEGGDADIGITREVERGPTTGIESAEWNLTEAMAPYYTLPPYVNELPPIEDYVDDVDRADGAIDGRWRENEIAMLGGGFDTPARAMYQQELVETVIEREGFGDDDVTDLLYVNFKATDKIGHLFSADGIEMADTLASQDAALERFVEYLDVEVGEGRWVMVLAADHGTQPDPDLTGAFMISADKLRAELAAEFDDADAVPLVQKLRPSQIWLDGAELRQNGATFLDVATFLLGLTRADTFMGPTPPDAAEAALPVFAAVLPSSVAPSLPCLPPDAFPAVDRSTP